MTEKAPTRALSWLKAPTSVVSIVIIVSYSRPSLRDCTTGCGTDGSICGTRNIVLNMEHEWKASHADVMTGQDHSTNHKCVATAARSRCRTRGTWHVSNTETAGSWPPQLHTTVRTREQWVDTSDQPRVSTQNIQQVTAMMRFSVHDQMQKYSPLSNDWRPDHH